MSDEVERLEYPQYDIDLKVEGEAGSLRVAPFCGTQVDAKLAFLRAEDFEKYARTVADRFTGAEDVEDDVEEDDVEDVEKVTVIATLELYLGRRVTLSFQKRQGPPVKAVKEALMKAADAVYTLVEVQRLVYAAVDLLPSGEVQRLYDLLQQPDGGVQVKDAIRKAL